MKAALHIDEMPALASSDYHREHAIQENKNLSEVEGQTKPSEGQEKPSEGKEKPSEDRKSSEGQEFSGSGKEIMSSIDKIVLATRKAQAKLASFEDN